MALDDAEGREGLMPPNHDGHAQGDVSHDKSNHIEPLDGLRGFAAMLVVISHFKIFGFGAPVDEQIGNYGVFLFFTLSGFLMGHLYLTKPLTRDRAWTYFAARISRIVPIYYLVIVAGFLYGRFIDPAFTYAMSPVDLVRHLLFVGNVSVFWSIGPEFQFYFLFPLMWWLISQPSERAVIWGVPMLFATLLVFLYRAEWPGILVLSKLHIFVAGILLSMIRPRLLNVMTPRAALMAQLLATAVLLTLLLPRHIIGDAIYPATELDPKRNNYYADFAKLFMLTLVVASFAFSTGYARSLLANRLMTLFGKFSFSVYLLHVPVFYAFKHLGIFAALPYSLAVVALLVTVVVVSALSFRLFEDPTRIAVRRWLLRLFRVSGARPSAPVQAAA